MNPRRIFIAFVTMTSLISAFGCKRSEEKKRMAMVAKAEESSAVFEKIDQFVYDGPLFLKDKTLAQERQLGVLKNEKVTFEANPHVDDAKIEFRTLQFDGLEVSGIVDKESFSAISVTVTDPRWQILHDLNVGSPAARVPQVLGQPPRSMNGPVEEFTGLTETVKFTVSQGKISKIDFIY